MKRSGKPDRSFVYDDDPFDTNEEKINRKIELAKARITPEELQKIGEEESLAAMQRISDIPVPQKRRV